MKMVKFKNDIYITKTGEESIVILKGENDEFWGMEGPLTILIFDLFSNKDKTIDEAFESLLNQYKVDRLELETDLKDCLDTLVDNGILIYV